MNIVKLVSLMLLLGITACGSSEKEAEVVVEEVPIAKKEPTVPSEQFCLTVSCEQTNKVVVEQIYNDVINGLNVGLVTSLYAEDFIQHNLGISSGISGQVSYFEAMTTNTPNHVATIKHIVADGDYVAVHWHYGEDASNEFVGTAWIDLYKVVDNVITEHWDVAMSPKVITESGNSVYSDLYIYPTDTQPNNDVAIEEENKTMVTDFYLDLFNNQNLDLIGELISPSYLQHNFWVSNGSGALFSFVSGGGTGGLSIFLTLAEDDIVWTFAGSGENNLTTVDLWRVDNNINKIVEHWDVF